MTAMMIVLIVVLIIYSIVLLMALDRLDRYEAIQDAMAKAIVNHGIKLDADNKLLNALADKQNAQQQSIEKQTNILEKIWCDYIKRENKRVAQR